MVVLLCVIGAMLWVIICQLEQMKPREPYYRTPKPVVAPEELARRKDMRNSWLASAACFALALLLAQLFGH